MRGRSVFQAPITQLEKSLDDDITHLQDLGILGPKELTFRSMLIFFKNCALKVGKSCPQKVHTVTERQTHTPIPLEHKKGKHQPVASGKASHRTRYLENKKIRQRTQEDISVTHIKRAKFFPIYILRF